MKLIWNKTLLIMAQRLFSDEVLHTFLGTKLKTSRQYCWDPLRSFLACLGFERHIPLSSRVASILNSSSQLPVPPLSLPVADAMGQKGRRLWDTSSSQVLGQCLQTPPHCPLCGPTQQTSKLLSTCFKVWLGPEFFFCSWEGTFYDKEEIQSWVSGGTLSHHSHL